jgi:hypothetical protein
MHLHDEELVKLKTSSLYAWINNLKLDKPPLVLETRSQSTVNHFNNDNYVTGTGNLMDVSLGEWKNINDWHAMTENSLYHDPRVSHLVKRNHTILANKIVDFFINQSIVDLTTDFYNKIIDNENVDVENKR